MPGTVQCSNMDGSVIDNGQSKPSGGWAGHSRGRIMLLVQDVLLLTLGGACVLWLLRQVLEVRATVLLRIENAGVCQLLCHMFEVQVEDVLCIGETNVH